MGFNHKMVIVVRTDINLSPGKLAVQVAHAAVSCALKAKKDRTKHFRPWYDEGQKKVVVKGFDLDELRDLQALAKKHDITTYMVTDAGMTEVPPGTVTCLGVGPGPAAQVDRITGKLSLW